MNKTTLRDKQKATSKHYAEQFPIFKKGVTGGTIFNDKPKLKGGRPKSGRAEMRAWVSNSTIATLKLIRENHGISEGVMIEMMMSICEPTPSWAAFATAPKGSAKMELKRK